MTNPLLNLNDKSPLSGITPFHLFCGLSCLSLGIMILGTWGMYYSGGPLPPPRKPPPVLTKTTITSYRYKVGFYRSLVEEDAKKIGLILEDTKGLWKSNAHFIEFSGNQRLTVGGTLETNHLRLRAVNEKIWVGEEGQGYRTEHMVLQIANKTDQYLAYRVLTEIGGKCRGKGMIQHNAIALKPNEQIERTECLLSPANLVIKQVEVLEISPLGYYYVSRLEPQGIQLDVRTSEGHHIPGNLKLCRFIPWREIQSNLDRGETQWHDVIDFYSRHNCDEYTFFTAYHWREQPPKQLPVRPPDVKD